MTCKTDTMYYIILKCELLFLDFWILRAHSLGRTYTYVTSPPAKTW